MSAAAGRAPARSGERDRALVLVVEEDREMNRFISESLAPDYRVATTLDGRHGLREAIELSPDLVLIETLISSTCADELVHAIRSHPKLDRTPIVLLSASTDDELRARLLREGAQDFLIRPFSADDLRTRVRNSMANERAEEIEAQWKSLIEQAPDGIFLADLDGRYTDVNAAGCRMLGYERGEIIGKRIVDLIPPGHAPRLWRVREQLLQGGVHVAEWMLRKKNGEILPVEVSAKILPDGRWQGLVRDISERKLQAELARRRRDRLREFEDRFRLTFDWAPIGMALVGLDGTFARVNHRLCEIVGYTTAELVGRKFQEITHPEDLDADLELAGRLLRGEIPRYQLAKRYLHKSGAIVDVMLSGSVLRDESGEPLYFIAHIEDITDRKRHEEDLGRTRDRLELALGGADLATWDWNVASGEVVFNPRWAQMRGYRLEEVRGHVDTWISGVHPDDWPRVKAALDRHFRGEADYATEHRVLTKSGEWIWVHDRGKVVTRNSRGEPARMAGTELDITARKRAEEALRLAEAKSTGIVSIAADAIISIDAGQRITLFNEGAERIFGRSKAETVGAPLDILIPERFRAIHREHVEKFAAGEDVSRRVGEREGASIFGLRENGEEFPAEAAISKLEVGDERVLTVVLRDVSEQRRVEREQRFLADVGPVLANTLEYEQTLSQIAHLSVRDLADFCIVDILDDDGEVRRLRVQARDPTKAWVAEALSRIPLDRTRPHLTWSPLETRKPVLLDAVTEDVLASWAQSKAHARALRGLGARSLVAVPLLAHGELRGVLALISATRKYGPADLRLAEELARRAALSIDNARLYREAKRAIQVRDEVLGIVAHDLRNPLNTILMAVSLLRRPNAEPERRSRSPADSIERAATRMNRLIEDLLDVARMEAGRLSIESAPLSVEQVVSDALEAQRPLAGAASLELRTKLAPLLPDLLADRDRILQIFENLIGNAVKATEPGGQIMVGATPRDHEMLFWVADTGSGITADEVPHLFDRFWQARTGAHRGAGLGLHIVRGIVEAHGGHVWVESEPGRGSTFFFTIPTAPRANEQPAPRWSSEL